MDLALNNQQSQYNPKQPTKLTLVYIQKTEK